MSFKLFIYYCALCGGWAAFFAWALVWMLGLDDRLQNRETLKVVIIGSILAVLVSLVIGALDALMNTVGFQRLPRVAMCVLIGLVGGAIGAWIGQRLYGASHMLRSVGWALTGFLIGASLGIYDLVKAQMAGQGSGMAIRKIINGAIGGALGGLLGGILFDAIAGMGEAVTGLPLEQTPRAIGLVILGMCIGLLISLAHVILKEASVKVESGFRAGRQLILSKPETTIGRAESSDIGLFGDNGVERTHARILKKGDRWVLADNNTPSGTYLNGERVDGPTPLRSGDVIGVGRSALRFSERQKH
jgi:Inner membrane component of T3SS, cytoplasmic domain